VKLIIPEKGFFDPIFWTIFIYIHRSVFRDFLGKNMCRYLEENGKEERKMNELTEVFRSGSFFPFQNAPAWL